MFDAARRKGFQILTLHHAEAILTHDMPEAVEELEKLLEGIQIPIVDLIRSGGGEGALTQRLRKTLCSTFDWNKHCFEIKKVIDGEERESMTHEIDHVKRFAAGTFALEIEWNNKDPFFDRDLENFKRLHADGAISIGGIITRGETLQAGMRELVATFAKREKIASLQDLPDYLSPTIRQVSRIEQAAKRSGSFEEGWAHTFVSDKFGEATTHWRKLQDRVRRGVGNPCPLLLIGIPKDMVVL